MESVSFQMCDFSVEGVRTSSVFVRVRAVNGIAECLNLVITLAVTLISQLELTEYEALFSFADERRKMGQRLPSTVPRNIGTESVVRSTPMD